jgi:hypothetical protein
MLRLLRPCLCPLMMLAVAAPCWSGSGVGFGDQPLPAFLDVVRCATQRARLRVPRETPCCPPPTKAPQHQRLLLDRRSAARVVRSVGICAASDKIPSFRHFLELYTGAFDNEAQVGRTAGTIRSRKEHRRVHLPTLGDHPQHGIPVTLLAIRMACSKLLCASTLPCCQSVGTRVNAPRR